MAYDRYDTRQGPRDERSRSSDDRAENRFEGRERERSGGRDERGFFERAGEQISSWFGDDHDDDRRDRHPDDMRGRQPGPGASRSAYGRHDQDEHVRRPSFHSSERDYNPSYRREMVGSDRDQGGGGGGYRPMTGDYSRSEGMFAASGYPRGNEQRGSRSNWDRDEYRRTSFAGSSDRSQHHDPHYHEWRQRQIEDLDRDYNEYRREHQSKFENDFGSWRQTRQSKRQMLGTVREHMEVIGKDDEHVGTVDRVAGERIILTKSDPESGGAHHSLSCTEIDRVEGDRLILNCSAAEARLRWRDESRGRALFEREDQGEAGPHALDRSFSGTYRQT